MKNNVILRIMYKNVLYKNLLYILKLSTTILSKNIICFKARKVCDNRVWFVT